MKKLVLGAAVFTSTVSFAETNKFDMVVEGCFDGQCELIEKTKVEWPELVIKTNYGLKSKDLPKVFKREERDGGGWDRFVTFMSFTTGSAIGAVRSTLTTMRETAVAAGFTTFRGELEGPGKKVGFTYDLVNEKGSLKMDW